ncbi:hypothetical protein H6S82_08675 [Planktothrix sp. FACHB-1355]|uniref:Uncharacterized protein n=1 Tax=Aerosakkonema funiforme FACHB-1375 TaxID=2949571 RepID=A0A926VJE2_9CYAN|nr:MULTISPECIES: hypothetical protein [Oscillatoriales]MBD2184738.1 hypothetical protein [Aerosakkonema funiforme FACHB-1375]MBD3558932.1 hypothetical protein [Planktothrix sp. FACHB-1355]
MTPTLFGRWQTRLLLFGTVGLAITLPFALGIIGSGADSTYFWVIGYITVFGLGWDIVYNYLQKFRWDRDWPGAFQLVAGIWEAIFFILIVKILRLPLPGVTNIDIASFLGHYSLVWLGVYLASQSIMRILFPRWRFRGGQWL